MLSTFNSQWSLPLRTNRVLQLFTRHGVSPLWASHRMSTWMCTQIEMHLQSALPRVTPPLHLPFPSFSLQRSPVGAAGHRWPMRVTWWFHCHSIDCSHLEHDPNILTACISLFSTLWALKTTRQLFSFYIFNHLRIVYDKWQTVEDWILHLELGKQQHWINLSWDTVSLSILLLAAGMWHSWDAQCLSQKSPGKTGLPGTGHQLWPLLVIQKVTDTLGKILIRQEVKLVSWWWLVPRLWWAIKRHGKQLTFIRSCLSLGPAAPPPSCSSDRKVGQHDGAK